MNLIKLATESDFHGWRRQIRLFLEQRIPFTNLSFSIEPPAQLYKRDYTPNCEETPPFFNLSRQSAHLILAVFSSGEKERFELLYAYLEKIRDHETPDETEDPLLSKLISLSHDTKKEALLIREKISSAPVSEKTVLYLEVKTALLDSQATALLAIRPNNWLIHTPDRIMCALDSKIFFAPAPSTPISEIEALYDFAQTQGIAAHESRFWQSIMPFPIKPTRTFIQQAPSLNVLNAYAADCQLCPLCKAASRTVTGEGNPHAKLMFVGEQPGDQEDLQGRPFVGPAGQLFDRALQECGIKREKSWVTNAVKHFRFTTPYGNGRRLHQKPGIEHINACSVWLQKERELLKPKVTIMMGVTAGTAILGRPITVSRERSKFLTLQDGSMGLVTVHPSFLLRQPDDSRAREYDHFVADLKLAYSALS